MNIDWRIEKRRGNHRPVLRYSIELEPFEIDLAVPVVLLEEGVPCPPSAWRSHCYPGQDERSGPVAQWHRLMTPSHKQRALSETLTLPWREPGDGFEDVRAAFERLRRDFEAALRSAYDSAPVELVGRLELSETIRREVAAGVAAARFLAAAGF